MRVLLFLVAVAVVIWALIEAIQADSRAIRVLPKAIWVVIIIFVPFGALAWFIFGRPKVAAGAPKPGLAPRPGPRPGRPAPQQQAPRLAPDDDPEFLRRLSQQAEQQRKLRLLEEGRTADEPKAKEARPDGGDKPDPGDGAPPRS